MSDYYILGSKRRGEENHWEDRLPDMVSQKVLEVGWGWRHRSFERLYNKPEAEIISNLKKLGEPPASYNAHKLFLNLRPGDWVAVKKHGAPHRKTPVLVIKAYARVVQHNGVVYQRGKPPLNHCINAEFVEHGKEHTFRLGYGATIHRLTNPEHIRQIFAPVLGKKLQILSAQRKSSWLKKGALLGRIEKQMRQTQGKEINVQQTHHRMRNKLYRLLAKRHGEANVIMEQGHVDLQVFAKKALILYEIKPYKNALVCIREALGQILLYAWREMGMQKQKVMLIVVGPTPATIEEDEFIEFIKRNVKIDFEYLCFK